MQIHELNNFGGSLGSGSYLAIDNGTDTGKISSQGLLAATEARIDNIIAGPAPSAQEVTDARLGADGVTYSSLGDAIRNQVSDLMNDITEITGNKSCRYTRNKYIALNGTTADVTALVSSETYECVAVPCSEGDIFRVTAQGQNATRPWGFVAANGTVLSVAAANSSVSDLMLVAPADSMWLVSNNQFVNNPNAMVIKGEPISVLKERSDLYHDVLYTAFNFDKRNFEYSLSFEQGGFSSGNVNNTLTTRIRTNLIDLSLFKRATISANSGYEYYYILFNSAREILDHSDWLNSDRTINFTNAKYIRLQARHTESTTDISPTEGVNVHLAGEWLMVDGSPTTKWYVLGDSISAGYYSMTASMAAAEGKTFDYISPVTTDTGETTGSVWDSSLAHNYWGYINQWYLHRTLEGKAIPGQGYFHVASYNSKNGINVVNDNDFSDAGLITVAWGFNDWHYNMPRGTTNLIDSTVPIPTDNFDTSRITTVNGAIWYCLGRLIKKAPKAKILVQTPLNGWAYGGDFSTKWSIEYAMSQSGTLRNIHDDIIYWCNYYGLEYIDLTYNNSIVNLVNIKDTIIDGSHPSDEAHQQLARSIWTKVGY